MLKQFFNNFSLAHTIALAGIMSAVSVTGPSATASELALDEAIAHALQSNLGLRVERINPWIQAEAVTAEEAVFDPLIFGNARYRSSEQDFTGTTSDQRSYSAGVRKRIVTGAEVVASTSLTRNDGTTFSPDLGQVVGGNLSQNADFSLSITQPLLRGFGVNATLAELRRAESLDRATRLHLQRVIMDTLRDIELAYWGVADARSRRELRESSRELALQLVEETRQRSELGLATRLELLQAEANLAAREQEIIAAEQLLSDRSDHLISLMGILEEHFEINQRLEVTELPTQAPRLPDFPDVWRTALVYNPETAIQDELILRRDLDTLSARDAMRPQLDVTLSGGYRGLSDESGRDAYSNALERDGHEWGAQVSFSYPFGRRASRAGLRQAEYRREQAEWERIRIKQQLLQDTRSAWRDLQVARRQLDASEITVRLQEASYEQERSRYEEGLSTTRAVLEAQRDLDAARTSMIDARFAALAAEIQLDRHQGLLLERHGLEWSLIAPETLPRSNSRR